MYKIRRFPVFGAQRTKQPRSALMRVLPDGRTVVDAKELLDDPKVKSIIQSIEEQKEAESCMPKDTPADLNK